MHREKWMTPIISIALANDRKETDKEKENNKN